MKTISRIAITVITAILPLLITAQLATAAAKDPPKNPGDCQADGQVYSEGYVTETRSDGSRQKCEGGKWRTCVNVDCTKTVSIFVLPNKNRYVKGGVMAPPAAVNSSPSVSKPKPPKSSTIKAP